MLDQIDRIAFAERYGILQGAVGKAGRKARFIITMTVKDVPVTEGWEPRWALDLSSASTKALDTLVDEIRVASAKEPPVGPVEWENGWYLFNPEMAEKALLRNGANRKIALATVTYYTDQMERKEWVETGETIAFDTNGRLINGQHRATACYLSRTPFPTYLVTDVPARPDVFAFIDNVKARTPAHALQTAGLNGASALISQVLKMAEEFDGGYYTGTQVSRHPRLSPLQYLQAADQRPNARRAVHLTQSDYEDAVTIIGQKDVVGFVAMKIIDLFGQATSDLFFDELIGTTEGSANDPLWALRKLMVDDAKKQKKRMKRHIVLANVILAFNAWKAGEPVKKRWFMASHEDFPRFIESDGEEVEAEEEEAGEEDPVIAEAKAAKAAQDKSREAILAGQVPASGIEGHRSTGKAGDHLEYAARMREIDAETQAHLARLREIDAEVEARP